MNDPARSQSLPLRFRCTAEDGEPAKEGVVRDRFRLGYGDGCDVQLPGGNGPGVVFEVENRRGPLLIARALPPEECARYVDLRINGEPLGESQQMIHPGARVDIIDKATQRHYQMVVESQVPHAWLRPRNLAIVIVVLALLGAAFGGYLYRWMLGAHTEAQRTSERVERAEIALQRTAQELLATTSRMGTSDRELASAIEDLRRLQGAASRELQKEFTLRVGDIERQAREISEQNLKSTSDVQLQVQELRDEFSQRMVSAYQQVKQLERSLLEAMAERFAARGPAEAQLKSILAESQNAVLFMRTRFQVRLGEADEPQDVSSLGSGFLVGPDGLAITAQHVMYPWRYDKDLLVLTELGLAEVIPDSVRWSVWPSGRVVLDDPHDPESFREADAYHSDGTPPGVRVLAVPEPAVAPTVVASPLGMVQLPVPQPGPSDVVVFRLDGGVTSLPYLTLADTALPLAPLDQVLAVGFPYSRLQDGESRPQGVRGFVRRVGKELLEIDAAIHPGLSGAPLMGADGQVVGMLSATLGSEVYGVAVLARDLRVVMDSANARRP